MESRILIKTLEDTVMRKFLFASHAYLAQGILSSLELIMGKQETVDVLCAYIENDFDIKKEIESRINALKDKEELIVITDVFGGSVNNEFMSMIEKTDKKVFLIAGLSLALLMSLVAKKDDEAATEEIISECIEEAKDSILFCNTLLEQTQEILDEDF